MKTLRIILTAMLLAVPALRAQIVADGATNTLSNVTNNFTGDVTVGTNGSFTLLVLSDNALLTNSANGLIGRNAGANSNEVQLLSATARWHMGNNLFVGSNGPFNRLVISNGATVLAGGSSTLGNGGDFSGNANSNTVAVSGAGSLWSNGLELVVGELGFANRLEVNNGGRVLNSNAFVGRSFFSPSNTVVVTGAGSLWSNRADLSLGGSGNGNLLVVSNGGWVVNSNASVGLQSAGNLALVTGINSTWSNRADLYVGNGARGNQLVVSDGAVVVDNNGVLGNSVTSSNNSVVITGSGSLWSNRTDLSVGSTGGGNLLVISNGGVAVSGIGYVSRTGAGGNSAVVSGAGSVWSNRSAFYVGLNANGAGNLRIENGGTVLSDAFSTMGFNLGANSNTAVVTGAGSLWSSRLDLRVGEGGGGNRLEVNDGGHVVNSNGFLGAAAFGLPNVAMVSGANSIWSNRADLSFGGSAVLIVSNGGLVVNSNATLGGFGGADSALVTGLNSTWSNRADLFVGGASVGNQLAVSNGATLSVGGSGFVGANPGANSNSVTVTGAGSVWSNSDSLYVGYAGSANRTVISNGGVAQCIFGELGDLTGSDSNVVQVTDAGSIWNSSILYVGLRGRGNRLFVTNGGFVSSELSSIGNQVSATGNEAVVTGAGSVLSNRLFEVGSLGSGNQLTITNGGTVLVVDTNSTAASLVIGASLTATNNRVTVNGGTLRVIGTNGTGRLDVRRGTNVLNAGLIDADLLLLTNTQGFFEFKGGTLITRGAGISNNANFNVGTSGATPAIWDVRSGPGNHVLAVNLFIGTSASFNQLLITNGASLLSDYDGWIGLNTGANSNSALITGGGSRWSARGVTAGSESSFNRLIISNGAAVFTGANGGVIGGNTGGRSNLAVVTGFGSVWGNTNDLIVGGSDVGNQLIVSDGGVATNALGVIGFNAGATNNTALVTGAGSTWNNGTSLVIGRLGGRNQLVVSNGAVVFSGGSILVGTNATSTNNRVVVDGSTMLVTNGAANGLLEIRRGIFTQNSGLVVVDRLLVTNTLGQFLLNGGTLSTRSTTVGSGIFFHVGNNIGPATMILAGNGTHVFSSLSIDDNSTLTGNGTIGGVVVALNSGTISPGASIGKMILTNAPFLLGRIFMEISKNGAVLTNDQIQVTVPLTYDRILTVSNLGPTALANGDKFQLFSAPSYGGSFTTLTLPPLGPGLTWKTNLLVDGSIEVFAPPAIPISSVISSGSGSYTQNFDSLEMSGANLWRDNSTLLGWYAAKSNPPVQFTSYVASDGSGNSGGLFSFGTTGSSERALGAAPVNSLGNIAYGLCFSNDTAGSVSNFVINYTGEQWRNGLNANNNTLTFWYQVSPNAITNPEPAVVTNWTQVSNLNFLNPTLLVPEIALDGNQPTNRHVFSSVLIPGLVVSPGQNVFFRWRDINDSSADQGMAVDDLTITFSALPLRITSIISTSGFAQLTGLGESNVTYGIEAASNLNAPIFWQRIGSNTANGAGVFQFTDTNAPAFLRRFYRALFP